MASGGVVVYGYREGFRSEGLAQFALSAFGPATIVSGPDDHGIDLVCNVSKRENGYLKVGHSYVVQVKSTAGTIQFEGEHAVAWLTGLSAPLFICVVDKAAAVLEMYSTWNLSRALAALLSNPTYKLTTINLIPGSETVLPDDSPSPETIPLGGPILRFGIADLGDLEKRQSLGEALEAWVNVDRENQINRHRGLAIVRGYLRWETNKTPTVWYRPFHYSPESARRAREVLVDCAAMVGLCLERTRTMAGDTRRGPEQLALASYVREFCQEVPNDWCRQVLGIDNPQK